MGARGYAGATLLGNLTADVEYRGAEQNVGIVNVAVNKIYKGEEHVSFFKCTLFGKLLEALGQYLTKGKQVLIVAEPKQSRFQDNQGNNRSSIEFNVREIQLLGGNGGAENSSDAPVPPKGGFPGFDDDVPI